MKEFLFLFADPLIVFAEIHNEPKDFIIPASALFNQQLLKKGDRKWSKRQKHGLPRRLMDYYCHDIPQQITVVKTAAWTP